MPIFFISENKFIKKAKSLVENMKYCIIDCTNGNDIKKYNGSTEFDLEVPAKLLKSEEDMIAQGIDVESIKESTNNFLKSFPIQVLICTSFTIYAKSNCEINLFIVLNKRTYKKLATSIVKMFYDLIELDIVDEEVVYLYDYISKEEPNRIKKLLKYIPNNAIIKNLQERANDIDTKIKELTDSQSRRNSGRPILVDNLYN